MKVGSFRRDAKAMRQGEWVSPGPEFGEVEILTRAMLPAYYDALAARTAREARRVGGEAKIGMAFKNKVIVDCMIEFCLQDIRGLENDDGSPVTFEQYVEMIREEDYAELATMAIQATAQVGRTREDAKQDAAGNSHGASTASYAAAETSNG